MDIARANRLIGETSPYLLQHAHNPVDWYPWGPEALDKARREDKPVLLSVGYSACHWCHVMEHESFEDPAVADVMNRLFVCIKVDREERPDLDKIYQLAHQMLTQRSGGWPLNMFLTPGEHLPIFGGTYFPREPRHGMPGFVDVLERVAAYYRDHRPDLEQQNAAVRDAFKRIGAPAAVSAVVEPAVLDAAARALARQFDAVHGGFGGAPKFPHPTDLELLLRRWARTRHSDAPDPDALHMARATLHAMAAGGVYDQLGGGFFRYSVDAQWTIPHFEKMLYDNGPLQALYTDAAVATGDAVFKRVAEGVGEWVMREMQSPAGGYYSTLDADSEGHEGRYYIWDANTVRGLLDDAQWRLIKARYGLGGEPNFEGHWHLRVHAALDTVAEKLGLSPEHARTLLDNAHTRLFAERRQRVRPGRDEKILTAWNALMIKGMARAGRCLDRPDFIQSAQRALDFVRDTLWTGERLRATTKDGRTRLNAYLDDYVFMIDGILELLQARWRDGDLAFAAALADVVLVHYEDHAAGGFFFTADDHETLIHRHKPTSDDALPSGNGIGALVLLRLGHLLGETRYLEAAERALRGLFTNVAEYPHAHAALLLAVEEYLNPTQIVILRGSDSAMAPWQERCRRHYAPRRLVLAIPGNAENLPQALARRQPRGDVAAYICTGETCSAPLADYAELERMLAQTETDQ